MHDFFGEDCSGDGGVVKTINKEGTSQSTPREGSTVSVSWTMKHMDRDLESRSVKFLLGDGAGEGVGEYFTANLIFSGHFCENMLRFHSSNFSFSFVLCDFIDFFTLFTAWMLTHMCAVR